MKTRITNMLFATFLFAVALPIMAQDLHNQGATIFISPGTILHANGNVVNHPGSLIQNAGSFTINGNLTNQASLKGSGTIELMGSSPQVLDMGGDSVQNLIINNAANATLTTPAVVMFNLDFQAGKLVLGSNNISLDEAATITNYTSSKYVVTNGTGNLIQNGIGVTGRTGTIDFPVGNSTTSYNPASINNTTGTKDNFSVKVYPTIYNSYSGGVGGGGALSSSEEVDRTWVINEATGGGSNVALTLQWNAADEDGSFVRSNSAIAFYNGGWILNPNGGAASGSNPYTRSRSGLSTFSNTPFGLGSTGSPLPVVFFGFDIEKQNLDAHITWGTATQYNASHFEVERSFDAIHFETIGTISALKNTNTNTNYSFDDKMVLQNMMNTNVPYVYYRIKEVDIDGKTQSTGIKSLQVQGNATASVTMESVKLLPNPYNDNFAMLYNMTNNMRIDFRLLDMSGKLIYTQSANAVKGLNQFDFKGFGHLAQGIYMIEAQLQNGEKQLYKIVKN